MAQVNFSHQLVGQNRFSIAFSDQLPVVDDIGGFADIEGLTDIVVGDQHANALGLEVVDDLFDVAHRDRIDTGKGFVEQDELGCRGQCAGEVR